MKPQVKETETGGSRSVDVSNGDGETATSSKGYLAPVFVNREGFSVGGRYSIPVPVDSVHQAVVPRGSVGILPGILENASHNKQVNGPTWEQFSHRFTSLGGAEKNGCLRCLSYS